MKDKSVLQNVQLRENSLLTSVYMWLVAGLALTACVSYALSKSPSLMSLVLSNPYSLIIVAIAQLAVVFFLSARLQQMRTGSAIFSFVLYAVLTGITFSILFIVYSPTAITKAFFSAAGVFVGASVYGAVTKKNVRSWGRYLFMGLWGIIIASLINMFFYTSSLDLMISIVGVLLFTGLTVWDTNKICDLNREFGSELTSADMTKLGIMGALELYLDFINIFLYLLRIFGRDNH